MATKTSNLAGTRLENIQAPPESTVNAFFDLMDAATAGILNKAVTASVTLTTAEACNPVMIFTGTLTGNINIDLPSSATNGRARTMLVYNNTSGAFTLTHFTLPGRHGHRCAAGLPSA